MMLAAGPERKKRWIPTLLVLAHLAQNASAQVSMTSIGTKVADVACMIYKAFLDIGGALASLVFLAAAVQWITARDDVKSRVRQRETMMQVIVGLVILMLIKTAIMAVAGITDIPDQCK